MNTKTAGNSSSRKSNGKNPAKSGHEWITNKDRVMEDFRTLVSDGEELLRSTAHLSGAAVNTARSRFETQWNQAKAKFDDAQNAALEHRRRITTTADDYVYKNPWKAIGIASGIGLLIGVLLSRRS